MASSAAASPGLSLMQKIYLWVGFLTPIPSIALYVLVPGGTVKHFGGQISNSSKFWCSLTASGDAVIAYLMLTGILDKGKNPWLFKLIVRSSFLYSIFHFGGFWYWHTFGEKHPQGAAMYPTALAMCLAALIAWGR